MDELGGLFGWLLVALFGAAILNFFVKWFNKKYGKNLKEGSFGKKALQLLMKVFVRKHKLFGILAAGLLLGHFALQFLRSGLSLSGGLAASLLILQVALGIYAAAAHRPRKGPWFVTHRLIAVLLILAIGYHLLAPYGLNVILANNSVGSATTGITVAADGQTTFTQEELAKYNGQNGSKAYVAYKGVVYDVSNVPQWKNGKHNGQKAGTDLTGAISSSPHGDSVFKTLTVVGQLK
jgi:predicted heme/steroid binding protein